MEEFDEILISADKTREICELLAKKANFEANNKGFDALLCEYHIFNLLFDIFGEELQKINASSADELAARLIGE